MRAGESRGLEEDPALASAIGREVGLHVQSMYDYLCASYVYEYAMSMHRVFSRCICPSLTQPPLHPRGSLDTSETTLTS